MSQKTLADYEFSGRGYRDKDTLERLYHEEGLTQAEIGHLFDVSHVTISYWMENLNIKSRGPTERYGKNHLPLSSSEGYERWAFHEDGLRSQVYVHRLLAVSVFGFDAVADSVVHHKNGCEFDNRPENLEIMKQSEHASRHSHAVE